MLDNLLKNIGSTEETTFNELCAGLGDERPSDKGEWAQLFREIEKHERNGYIEVDRTGGRITSLILTEAGVAKVRNHRN